MLTTRLALISLIGFAIPARAQLQGRVVSPDGALELWLRKAADLTAQLARLR